MKVTKLVLLFNKDKLILGLLLSIVAFITSLYLSGVWSAVLLCLAIAISLNIVMSIYASHQLYDKSNLFKPKKLFSNLKFKEDGQSILLHASFDPISRETQALIHPHRLKVYNIYGNRHEDEKLIEVSNKVFPPHPDEMNVDPTQLPDSSKSIDYILAITSIHEILTQEARIQFFREAKRVLKDEGELIVCEQMRNINNFLFFNIGAFHFVRLADWKEAIKAAGMHIVDEKRLTIWGTILYVKPNQ